MSSSESKSEARSKFLGPPPLLPSDKKEEYKALQKQVADFVRPVDFLDDLTVRDVTDSIWEQQRYKRYQSELIESAFQGSLIQALTRIHHNDEMFARIEADKWFRGTPEEKSAIRDLLEQFGVNIETLNANAFSLNASSITVLERMIGNRTSLRSKALRVRDQFLRSLDKPIPGSIELV